MLWPLMAATGWTEDYVRWEMALVDVHRYRHAQIWLSGHRCKRAGRIGADAKARRRERFDRVAAKYARRN